ncbi:hypothetical protein IAT38_007564 [Cryptococcus sp. DSM 104549]
MLTTATAPPVTISPEEHAQLTSSTPSSFVDIPPILRWNDDVEVVMNTQTGGWESWPTGRITGKLFVHEDAVVFLPNSPVTPGFNLPFPSLTLHALTPASSDGPAHLYCQIDESDGPSSAAGPAGEAAEVNGNGNGHVNGDAAGEDEDEEMDGDAVEGGDEEEFAEMREVRIYLPDESKLEPLFQALSNCSALHDSLLPSGEPSSFFGFGGDDDDDFEGEDGQWEDADEEEGPGRVRSDFHSGGGPGARFRPY